MLIHEMLLIFTFFAKANETIIGKRYTVGFCDNLIIPLFIKSSTTLHHQAL